MNPNRGGLPPISQGTKDTKVGGGTGGGFDVGTKMVTGKQCQNVEHLGLAFFFYPLVNIQKAIENDHL